MIGDNVHYNKDGAKDIQLITMQAMLEGALDLLKRIVDEAIEHWPDAETWDIIQEAQDLVASKGNL